MKLLTFIGLLGVALLMGCATTRESGDSTQVPAQIDMQIVSNDSTRPGTTWTGEKNSVEKQKDIAATVMVVAMIITILTLGTVVLVK